MSISTDTVKPDRQLIDLIGRLGDHRDIIAGTLRDCGIRGALGEGNRCPIANWLVANLADVEAVSVGEEVIAVTLRGAKPYYARRLAISTPQPVARFVAAFDNNRYPDLVDDGEE